MAWQLIYTSAPRTLTAGQSGYGTVARHAEMREILAQRLEQISYYSQGQLAAEGSHIRPVVCAYRVLDVRGSKYHVLSRIQDAGLDFTRRTNHLAHHLVFEPDELDNLPSPTLIFLRWDRWRTGWNEEPRWLGNQDWGNLHRMPRYAPGIAKTWQEVAGDAGVAASLLEPTQPSGCYLMCEPGGEKKLLDLLGETLRLLDPEGRSPSRCWQFTFTTCLQAEDQVLDFQWRGLCVKSPAWQSAQLNNIAPLDPHSLVAPQNRLAQLARQGCAATAAPPNNLTGTRRLLKPLDATPPLPAPRMGLAPGARSTASAWDQADRDIQDRHGRLRTGASTTAQAKGRWLAAGIIVLLLVLLACLVWTGWFHIKKASVPPARSAPKLDSSATLVAPLKPSASSDHLAPTPVISMPPSESPLAQSVEVSENLQEQLERQFDSLATYVVMATDSNAVRLPTIVELDQLLVRLVKTAPPLSQEGVECLIQANTLLLATRGAFPASLDINNTRKELVFSGGTQLSFKLSFAQWSQHTNAPVWLRDIEPHPLHSNTMQSLTVVLRPREGAKDFVPFRLIVIARQGSPAPMVITNHINAKFLACDQNSLERSLAPPLWERIREIRFGTFRLELRAYLAANALWDAHRALGFKFPTNGVGLNFTELRNAANQQLALAQSELENIQAELRVQRDDRIQGLQMGPYTLGGFAKAHQTGLTRELYLDYLAQCLPRLSRELTNPKTRRSTLRELSKTIILPGTTEVVALSKPDFFLEIYNRLPSREKLADWSRQEQEITARISQWQNRLNLIPTGLDQLPRLGLFLVEPSGHRVEFIRFQ